MWGYQPHDHLILVNLIRPTETSSSETTRDSSGEAGETRVRNMAYKTSLFMPVGFFNMP
jgi:hypothetical protein